MRNLLSKLKRNVNSPSYLLGGVTLILGLTVVFMSPEASAANTCRLSIDTSHTNEAVAQFCRNRANTDSPDPEAQQGDLGWIPMFFVNPDECDLGLAFPDLIPDFGLDISKINSCEILKAVSKNAVNQVNEKFADIEKEIDDAVGDGQIEINPDDLLPEVGGGG